MEFLAGINTFLTEKLGPFGPLIVVGGLGLFMILLTVPLLLNQPEDPLKKLKKSLDQDKAPKTTKRERLRQGDRNEQLQKFANFLEPQNEEDLSAMELKLRQAGYVSRDAVRLFHFSQFALGILGLLAGLFYVYMLNADVEYESTQMMIRVIGPAGVGYYIPQYWVTRSKEEITSGFPDSLDMMLVCVEAGQSLDQAIVRVAKELRASCPALAEEFEIVAYEIKAGKDKEKVLRDMGTRCDVQDISSFVTVMIQSSSFGTSIAEALRVYSGEMRDKRVMRAEEAANKLPVKMTLATMILTVPPLLIILVGPSAQNISNLGSM